VADESGEESAIAAVYAHFLTPFPPRYAASRPHMHIFRYVCRIRRGFRTVRQAGNQVLTDCLHISRPVAWPGSSAGESNLGEPRCRAWRGGNRGLWKRPEGNAGGAASRRVRATYGDELRRSSFPWRIPSSASCLLPTVPNSLKSVRLIQILPQDGFGAHPCRHLGGKEAMRYWQPPAHGPNLGHGVARRNWRP